MSEMKNIATVLSEIEECRNSLNALYGDLKSLFDSQSPQLELIPQKPDEKSFTKDEVRSVLADKAKAGYVSTVKMLLAKHGGCTLSDIKPEDYGALVNDAHVYCREITKEEVASAASILEENTSKDFVKELLEYNYATRMTSSSLRFYRMRKLHQYFLGLMSFLPGQRTSKLMLCQKLLRASTLQVSNLLKAGLSVNTPMKTKLQML